VVVAQLEKWTPPLRYDLLIAAQSWHWVDAERRWDLAHDALAIDGSIALFWNQYIVSNEELRLALLDIDVHYDVAKNFTFHQRGAHEFADEVEVEEGWPEFDLKRDPRFDELTSHRYRRSQSYATSTYLDLLSSTSAYRMLDDDKRVQLFDEVAGVVNTAGGRVELLIVTDPFLGRGTKRDTFCLISHERRRSVDRVK
jgi:hypothetical protein